MLRRSNPTSKHLEGVAQQGGQAGKEFCCNHNDKEDGCCAQASPHSIFQTHCKVDPLEDQRSNTSEWC